MDSKETLNNTKSQTQMNSKEQQTLKKEKKIQQSDVIMAVESIAQGLCDLFLCFFVFFFWRFVFV